MGTVTAMAKTAKKGGGADTNGAFSVMIRALGALRHEWEFFPVHVAMLFLVAGHSDLAGKPLTVKGLAERIGMNDATTSRNIRVLSSGVGGQGGGVEHDLLALHPDPTDYRSRLVKLTPRGRILYNSVLNSLED